MEEENSLTKLARGPLHAFKGHCIDEVLEEILGRLGCLRRNQPIWVSDHEKLHVISKLITEHRMFVTTCKETEVTLAVVDTWKSVTTKPLVVVLEIKDKTLTEYVKHTAGGEGHGYTPAIICGGYLIFVRNDMLNLVGIKGVYLRNFSIVFYDQ